MGIVVSAMAMLIVLAVFSGLRSFSLSFTNELDPELKAFSKQGKNFVVNQAQYQELSQSPLFSGVARVVEDRLLFTYNEKQTVAMLKGVDADFPKVSQFPEKVDLALAYEEGSGGVEENAVKAVEYMTTAAEIGFSYAQYKLGCYYLYAYGLEKDLELAKYWLEKARENGSALAMLTLGDYYLYGYEEDQPYDLAFPYYEEAEQRGYVSEGLGICYQFAIGVERDEKKAFQFYKIAVERGYDAAYFRLGLCYYYAIGTEEDNGQ